MKLHLPRILFASIMALMGVSKVNAATIQHTTIGQYLDWSHSYSSGACHYIVRDMWKDWGQTSIGGQYYDNIPEINYQYIFKVTTTHDSSSHATTYTYGFDIEEDGQGKDKTWQCSWVEDGVEHVGMWILAHHDVTQEYPILLSNYGNIVVDSSRQQYHLQKAVGRNQETGEMLYSREIVNMADGGIISRYVGTTASITDVSFDLVVRDSESFTYKNAWTAGSASLVNGGEVVSFDNVESVIFLSNTAASDGDSAGIVKGADLVFEIKNASNVEFAENTGKNGAIACSNKSFTLKEVSGEAKFRGNKGNSLFYNVKNIVYDNISVLSFEENESPIYRTYNVSSNISYNNIGTLVFRGNTTVQKQGLITAFTTTSDISFVDIDKLEVLDNKSVDALISGPAKCTFSDVADVSFVNNESTGGYVISDTNSELSWNFTGVTKDFKADFNTAVSGETGNTGLFSRSLTVVGGSDDSASAGTLSMSNNTVTGSIYKALVGAKLSVENFEQVSLSNNTAESSASAYSVGLAEDISLKNVKTIAITGNLISSDNDIEDLAAHFNVENFESLEISNNDLSTSNGRASSLFDEMVASTEVESSFVKISSNIVSGTSSSDNGSPSEMSLSITGVSDFLFEKNEHNISGTTDVTREVLSVLEDTVTLTNIKNVTFNENKVETLSASISKDSSARGGATAGKLLFTNIEKVTFSGNSAKGLQNNATAGGGAVYVTNSGSLLQKIDEIIFENNSVKAHAEACGGAVRLESLLTFSEVGNISFINNYVQSSQALGGAVCSTVSTSSPNSLIFNADTVIFKNNSALSNVDGGSAKGGAISATKLTLQAKDELLITNNYVEGIGDVALYGGAISANGLTNICDAKEVTITGNYVKGSDLSQCKGGAIYMGKDISLYIKNNDKVTIRGNYITDGSTVRLQAIYDERSDASSNLCLYLQAKENQTIEIFDSISIGAHLKINTSQHEGTVTFSGLYTETDLAAINPDYTKEDVEASRKIEVPGVYAYGGTVEIVDGMSIISEGSVNLDEGIGAHLNMRDGTISAADSIITTTATFSGVNTLLSGQGTNKLQSDNWTLNLSEENKKTAVITLGSSASSATGTTSLLSLTIAEESPLIGGIYKLLAFNSDDFTWKEKNWRKLKLSGLCTSTSIGTVGENDVYFIVDGTTYTLVYDKEFIARSEAATLTWAAESGSWKQGSGLDESLWSAPVADRNYYNGDSVVFDKAADVILEGVLTPADLKVSNEEGKVSLRGPGQLTGSTAVTKSGEGTLELGSANAYTGGTEVLDGTLKVANAAALGLGEVKLIGGTLDMGGLAVGNEITVDGSAAITDAEASTGALSLNGGELSINSSRAGLTNLLGGTLVNMGAATNISTGKVYLKGAKLRGAFDLSGSAGWDVAVDSSIEGSLVLGTGSLTLHNTSLSVSETLTLGAATIVLDGTYTEGNSYTLLSAGSIDGELTSLVLDGITLNYELNIENNALVLNALAIETPDEPGTDVPGGDEPGIVGPGGDEPGLVGPGGNEPGIDVPSGDKPGMSEPESLKPFRPTNTVLAGAEVNSSTELILEGKGTLTLAGKVAPGAITVNNAKAITLKSHKALPGSLSGEGTLTKKGVGVLTINDGNTSWTGDTYLESGTIKVMGASSLGMGDVYVKGGILNLASKAVSNDIVQQKTAAIKSGKLFTGTYTLESGELLKGSTLNIAKSATLAGGTLNGTLTGSGAVNITGAITMGANAKIKTAFLNMADDVVFHSNSKGLAMGKSAVITLGEMTLMHIYGKTTAKTINLNCSGLYADRATKPVAVSLTGDMNINDGSVAVMNGKVSATNIKMDTGRFYVESSKPQSVTLKGGLLMNNNSDTKLTGKLTTRALSMSDSVLSLKNVKPQAITVNGHAQLNNSILSTTGKITVNSLTLNGSSIRMSGAKPQTLKVKGALTIQSGSQIIMDYDYAIGKAYKIVTFGSFKGGDLYDIFGVSQDVCVLQNTGTSITLMVFGNWNPQETQTSATATVSAASVQTAVASPATEEKKPVAAAATVAVEPNPAADALVQANWGQLEASRAFVNAIANRSNATQLGNGERAVWASAIGSSSRHDTAGGHNGADTNVSGGVFGLETQVGRASLFGMALGNSWTRVSAHGFGSIEQDTTHLGVYGQTNWRSGMTADWSAAYGRSESETMGSDWNQKHLQLDGRVSYNHELKASTVLSPFAGLQYYASDSATVDGTNTGSLQNLRAEIGVAASRRTGKLGVFGEIALHQDMARNNPSVSMEGNRYTGMNPGRTGLNFTIGASYELNDKWSVNASYTGEFVENANAHSANVGASYKF